MTDRVLTVRRKGTRRASAYRVPWGAVLDLAGKFKAWGVEP